MVVPPAGVLAPPRRRLFILTDLDVQKVIRPPQPRLARTEIRPFGVRSDFGFLSQETERLGHLAETTDGLANQILGMQILYRFKTECL